MKPSASEHRGSLVDGHLLQVSLRTKLSANSGILALIGSTTEIEEYAIDLNAVSVLKLAIQPDLGRREAVATLAAWLLRGSHRRDAADLKG
jgi:hypothetical protein